jgi:hypothetical protein
MKRAAEPPTVCSRLNLRNTAMEELRVEPTHRVQAHRCPCCGAGVTSVHGLVYRDHVPYGAYRAALYLRHPGRRALVTVALDADGVRAAGERVAMAVNAWPAEDGPRMDLLDVRGTVLGTPELLGRVLTPREVMLSPLKDEFLRVADEVCDADPVLRAFLDHDQHALP